jgi:transcriptional antiterminator NusG
MAGKKTKKSLLPDKTDDKDVVHWYVVNTYSGHENRVKADLEKRIESMGIQDSLFRVLIYEQPDVELKNGKPVEKMKNQYAGYIFVQMKMTDEAWYVVRNTPGVTGFIGSHGGGSKPYPVPEAEMESVLRHMGQLDKTVEVSFHTGDTVRILSGPFSGMEGQVSAMNDQTQVATVLIQLFGRETPTDHSYNDLEMVNEEAAA